MHRASAFFFACAGLLVLSVTRPVTSGAQPPPYLTQWGGNGGGPGQFNLPSGIVVDGSGIVYVADYGNFRVQKFTANGAWLKQNVEARRPGKLSPTVTVLPDGISRRQSSWWQRFAGLTDEQWGKFEELWKDESDDEVTDRYAFSYWMECKRADRPGPLAPAIGSYSTQDK